MESDLSSQRTRCNVVRPTESRQGIVGCHLVRSIDGGEAQTPLVAVRMEDVVVAHAGVMRAIASFALRLPLEACQKLPLAMGAIAWLRRDGSLGEWSVVHWNA